MPEVPPYLSVVVVSRNDDHGGNPLQRTQLCINSLYEQCNRYQLPAELMVVDWNPPPDRPGLAEVIQWPADRRFIRTRVITVPPEFHRSLPHSDNLQLFQMIGKNVGIRRARGEYVLATNIDILFSDELMKYLSKKPLQPGQSYRVDRFDIRNDVLQEPPEKIMSFCGKHILRVNTKLGTFFNPVIGKLGKIIYPASDAVMLIFGNRLGIVVENCFRIIVKITRNLSRWCLSVFKSGISSGKLAYHRLGQGLHTGYFKFTGSVKHGVSNTYCLISGISLKIGALVVPKKYRSPLRNLVSRNLERSKTAIISFFVSIKGGILCAWDGVISLPGKLRVKMYAVLTRLRSRTHVPADKKNSMTMLIELLLYRVKVKAECGFPFLHFNGCGDFALMSKADWDSLGGYLEDPIFSWNVDSLVLIDAYYCGIPEKYLLPPKTIHHVEHSAGSGWTPGKGEQLLFERLAIAGTPYFRLGRLPCVCTAVERSKG